MAKSAREKIKDSPPPKVEPLDGAKAARFKADSMLIPSPAQIQDAIVQIPRGQTVTMKDLRSIVAAKAGAGTTCPLVAGIFWRLLAEAGEENRTDGIDGETPWWRVTKDGKPNPKLPGGAERHRALLLEEGVTI